MDYWERLKALGIYSLQRRRERYKILYIWKITNGLVPNPAPKSINIEPTNSRRGQKAERWIGKARGKCYKSVNKLIFNSFSSTAVGLYCAVPAAVKEQSTIEGAKAALDKFLSTIPDKPPTRNYTAPNNNSILTWLEQGAGRSLSA